MNFLERVLHPGDPVIKIEISRFLYLAAIKPDGAIGGIAKIKRIAASYAGCAIDVEGITRHRRPDADIAGRIYRHS